MIEKITVVVLAVILGITFYITNDGVEEISDIDFEKVQEEK